MFIINMNSVCRAKSLISVTVNLDMVVLFIGGTMPTVEGSLFPINFLQFS
jgi:hypothetical protein